MGAENEVGLQIRIRSSADLSGVDATTQSMSGLDVGSKAASESMRDLWHSSHEAEQILGGLERGGVGGAITALRGLAGAARTLGPAFLEGSAIAAAFATPILLAIHEMNQVSKENFDAIDDGWDSAKDRAEKYKKTLEEVKKAAEEWGKQEKEKIDEINTSLAETEKWHAAIEAREKKEEEAAKENARAQLEFAKQKELAGAATQEDRARIEGVYAGKERELKAKQEGGDLENEQLRAKQKLTENLRKETELSDERQDIAIELSTAEADMKDKIEQAAYLMARANEQRSLQNQQLELRAQQDEARKVYMGLGGTPEEKDAALARYNQLGTQIEDVDKRAATYGGGLGKAAADAQATANDAKKGYEELVKQADDRQQQMSKALDEFAKNVQDANAVLATISMRKQTIDFTSAAGDQAEANKAAEEIAKGQRTLTMNASEEERLRKRNAELQRGEPPAGGEVEPPLATPEHDAWLTRQFTGEAAPAVKGGRGSSGGGMTQEQKDAELKANTEKLAQLTASDTNVVAAMNALKTQHEASIVASRTHVEALRDNTAATNRLSDRIGNLGGTLTRGDGRTITVPPTVTSADTSLTRTASDTTLPAGAIGAAQMDAIAAGSSGANP